MSKGPKRRVPKAQTPVRTGGFMGDPDMDALEKYARDGNGVDESIEDVGSMPNEKFVRGAGPEIV